MLAAVNYLTSGDGCQVQPQVSPKFSPLAIPPSLALQNKDEGCFSARGETISNKLAKI